MVYWQIFLEGDLAFQKYTQTSLQSLERSWRSTINVLYSSNGLEHSYFKFLMETKT